MVGTGGASHGKFRKIKDNSQVRNANTYGVLKLTLRPTNYSWKFVPVAGKTFTDSGNTNVAKAIGRGHDLCQSRTSAFQLVSTSARQELKC